MASYDVAFALVGGYRNFDDDASEHYLSRPTETLHLDGSTTLAEGLRLAQEIFEIAYPGDYRSAGLAIDFYRGDPNEAVTLSIPMTRTVTLVDAQGMAIWDVPSDTATFDAMVKAKAAGVFVGNPLRPYLLVDRKALMAGGVPGGWDEFIAVWDALLYLSGSATLAKYGYRLTAVGRARIQRVASRWLQSRMIAIHLAGAFEARNADITDVIATIRSAQRHRLSDLMLWTGITDPAEAENLAGLAGYDLVTDGVVEFSLDEVDEVDEQLQSIPFSCTDSGGESESLNDELLQELAEILFITELEGE